MPRNIVIYRENLLAYSETFILNQAESLQNFRPYYVGTRRLNGLSLPEDRSVVLSSGTVVGRAEELLYKFSGFAPRLHARLRQIRPALIHAHFGSDGVMALPLARRLRVPLLVTFHGYDAAMHDEALLALPNLRDRRLVQQRPQLIREATLFLAVSEHIRRLLIAKGFPAEKIVTHYNGVDTHRFDYRDPAQASDLPPLVLFVGRMVEKKGVADLLRAMQQVRAQLPEARLVLLGDGPLLTELQTLAGHLGLPCDFMGRQSVPEIQQWMAQASLLCVPSVTAQNGDTEGLPTVVLEAQACGLPVVATEHAGIPEAVQHEVNGLVVPERDPAQLAAALTRLLTDAPLRQRFGQAARREVVRRFDAGNQVRVLEQLYTRVIGQQLPSAAAQRSVTS
ncbi:glycosyltransferase [Deinococcus sonorensis]|uniref:Glycosyltransferase n=2 Tax=Deinococcus sonorensis TaxID=309891 RepID=A0AAU7UD94_9DEIO